MIAQQYIARISISVKRLPDVSEVFSSAEQLIKVAAVTMIALVFALGVLSRAGSILEVNSAKPVKITVKEGDTLWKYAAKYGRKDRYILSRLDEIAKLNNIPPSTPIQPGMKILVPK